MLSSAASTRLSLCWWLCMDLKPLCVSAHRLHYATALESRDDGGFWRVVNVPLTNHQIQKIQATATKKATRIFLFVDFELMF